MAKSEGWMFGVGIGIGKFGVGVGVGMFGVGMGMSGGTNWK